MRLSCAGMRCQAPMGDLLHVEEEVEDGLLGQPVSVGEELFVLGAALYELILRVLGQHGRLELVVPRPGHRVDLARVEHLRHPAAAAHADHRRVKHRRATAQGWGE